MKPIPVPLWRNTRSWLPGVLVSLVVLAAILRLARWEDFKLAFSTVRPLNLTIAAAVTLVSLGVRALVWQVLLAWKSNFQRSFFIINMGYLLNNVLPLRAGEIARAVFMGQASGLGTFHVLSTIVIERAFDVAMAAGLLLATLPMVLGMAWARTVAILMMILVILGLLVLYLIARNSPKVHRWISRAGTHRPLVRVWIVPRLDSLLDGLNALIRPERFLLSALGIAMSWVLWVTVYYIMLMPVAPQLHFYWAVFATAVAAMGIAIPAAPGGLGIYEASLVGALAIFGISPSASLAVALVIRSLNFSITGILGFYELARSRSSLSTLLQQAR